MLTPANVAAALLLLVPYLAVAFFPQAMAEAAHRLPLWTRLACPALLAIPYALVTSAAGDFRWTWLALYAALPVAIAVLLHQAARSDSRTFPAGRPLQPPQAPAGEPAQHGNWREFLIEFAVLAALGLAVDLRWFERAWPAHLAIFNKVLLLDAGIYGFVLIRRLDGAGFDLRLRLRDLGIGLRELVFYAPLALALGLSLGFLHAHAAWPGLVPIAQAWLFTFFFIAVPEELFFRGWLQNLLERSLRQWSGGRMGRNAALILTAALFGLAHFNKRTASFNWRYVLLAALAGIFYGRAWRRDRRVAASAVTHASVDAIWSLWMR